MKREKRLFFGCNNGCKRRDINWFMNLTKEMELVRENKSVFFLLYHILYNLKLKLQQFDTRKICSVTIFGSLSCYLHLSILFYSLFDNLYWNNFYLFCVFCCYCCWNVGLLLKVHGTLMSKRRWCQCEKSSAIKKSMNILCFCSALIDFIWTLHLQQKY